MSTIPRYQRVLCVGLAVVLTTESSVRGAKTEETPYETVRTASHFAIGGVGVAGTITPEELAMRKIRDGPQSEQQLRSLIREGTPAGQMYALFALRQLKTADYVTLSAPYRQNSLSVPTISGCIIHTQTMSEAVRWIDQYAIKMRTWEQSRVAPQKSSGLHINSAQPGAS